MGSGTLGWFSCALGRAQRFQAFASRSRALNCHGTSLRLGDDVSGLRTEFSDHCHTVVEADLCPCAAVPGTLVGDVAVYEYDMDGFDEQQFRTYSNVRLTYVTHKSSDQGR